MAIPLVWSLVLFGLKAAILALRADVICSHWLVPCGAIGSLLSVVYRKPHVIVEHSGALHLLTRGSLERKVLRLILAGAAKVVVVSGDLREKLIKAAPDAWRKCEVVPMGVDCQASYQEPLTSPARSFHQIGFIGRLTEIKGVEVLFEAVKALPECRLLMAGEGDQRQNLEELAIEMNLDVRFVGRVGSKARSRLLSACDVIVVPSVVLSDGRTEGVPVVCLEAMAAGRPVIASRVGGIPEVIVEGKNGMLFSPGDCDDLSEKLEYLFSNPEIGVKLAANGLQKSRSYDWSVIGSRFSVIIKGLLIQNDSTNHSGRLSARGANG
jgi:glycosyltransferase involved in cell wall biosynthesis